MLKRTLTTEEHGALDAPIQALYKQDGDAYALQLEEAVTPPPEPITPTPTSPSVPEGVNYADLANMVVDLKDRLEKSEAKQAAEAEKASIAELRQRAFAISQEHGVSPSAYDDVLRRMQEAGFHSEEGGVVARNPDGSVVQSQKVQNAPLSAAEFITGLRSTAAHLFRAPTGVGDPGSLPTTGIMATGSKIFMNPTQEQKAASIEDIVNGKIIPATSDPITIPGQNPVEV